MVRVVMTTRWLAAQRQWLTSRSDLIILPAGLALDMALWLRDPDTPNSGTVGWWLVPISAAAAMATLTVRRDYPVAVFVFQIGYAVASNILLGATYDPLAGILIALHM